MGTFSVTIGVGHPAGGDLTEVSAMVDTGATYTTLPGSLLENLHVQPIAHRSFTTKVSVGRGQGVKGASPPPAVTERGGGVGQVRIVYGGESWICPVAFGPEGIYLLGATTLEIFDLVVDPAHRILIQAEHIARPF